MTADPGMSSSAAAPQPDFQPPVRLRPVPLPYRAMVAICSDIDGARVDTFRETHRFLNTTADTAVGPGVGLDIADSAWFYQPPHDGKISDQIAYFTDYSGETVTPWAAELIEYMRCGWVDTLHTYGNFSDAGEAAAPFAREHAVRALAVLERAGVTLKVWVNHGDRHNRQNIGPNINMQGDRPGAPEYHADLLRAHGTEYIWAHGSTDVPGGASVVSAMPLNDGSSIFGFRRFSWRRKVPNAIQIARFYGLTVVSHQGDELLQLWHPKGLPFQLATELLTDLADSQHLCVFAQHLGFMFPLTTFDAETVAAFRHLRQLQDDGQILVARTARLVHYNRVRDHLRFSVVADACNRLIIDIGAIEDPVRGSWLPAIEDVRGISFEADAVRPVGLRLNGKPIAPCEVVEHNDGNRISVGIRWFEPDTTDYALPFLGAERRSYVLWNKNARIRAAAAAPAIRAFLSSQRGVYASRVGSGAYLSAADCARECFGNGLERYAAAFERAGLSEMDRGLDIGCGPGHWSLAFLHHGRHVVGLDDRREFVALAGRIAHRFGHGDRAQFAVAAMTGYWRGRNRFDCAWSHSPRVFAADAQHVIANIARLLRPGAPLLCRYFVDGDYIRQICEAVDAADAERVVVVSERYLNAQLRRCGIFHVRGPHSPIMTLVDLVVLGRSFGLGYVGQPVNPDEPTRFCGHAIGFDVVLRKTENPEAARARLFEPDNIDAGRLNDLEQIALAGAPRLVCVLLRATDPELAEPSARRLFARSLIRAGLACHTAATACFDFGSVNCDLTAGLYRHDRGDYPAALLHYARLDNSSRDKAFLSGMCHYHQGEWGRAGKAFATALEQPGGADPRIWAGLIAAYQRLGDRKFVVETRRALAGSVGTSPNTR
jgi:SAM-dependent methyltransferase